MLSVSKVIVFSVVSGLIVLFCRAIPFLLLAFGGKNQSKFKKLLDFVENAVPPCAMTVLAVHSIADPLAANIVQGADLRGTLPVLIACTLTAALHIWKRNPLLSIAAGTIGYIVLYYNLG